MSRWGIIFLLLTFAVGVRGQGIPNPPQPAQGQLPPFFTSLNSSTTFAAGGQGGQAFNPIADCIYTEAFLLQMFFGGQLLLGEASNYDAQTDKQMELNYRKWIQNAALMEDFESLRREQYQFAAAMFYVRRAAHFLDDLKLGNVHESTIKALDYVKEQFVPGEVVQKLMMMRVPRLTPDNFYVTGKRVRIDPFLGGAMIDFIEFLREKKYSLRFSSPANFVILDLLGPLYEATFAQVQKMLAQMDRRRKEVFSAYQVEFRTPQ